MVQQGGGGTGNISWSLPKGHVEAGEDRLIAAKREIYEETGLTDLTFVKELGEYQRPRLRGSESKYHPDESEVKSICMFLFKSNQETLQPTDPHNPQAKWTNPGEAIELLTHDKDKEFLSNVLAELADKI